MFEGVAEIGDYIKVLETPHVDTEPDDYWIGLVLDKDDKAYTVKCINAEFGDYVVEEASRIGTVIRVPFEIVPEWEGRITLLSEHLNG